MSEEVEAIREDLFRIRVPLPNNPLRELNSYVIRDGQQSLIIDTGFNRPACLEVMERGIAELGLDLIKLIFPHPSPCGSYGAGGAARLSHKPRLLQPY